MNTIKLIISVFFLVSLSACYKFESDPLAESGKTFEGSKLYEKIKGQFNEGVPKVPASNGQPSPIGDIALTSSVLELSENSIFYSHQQKGAWELGMMSIADTHAYICNIVLLDETQLVSPPDGLTLEVKSEQMGTSATVNGSANLYLRYAQKLADESMKTCIAIPMSSMR